MYYTGVLHIRSNVGAFELEFFSSSTAQRFSRTCENSECILRDLPPIEYTVTFLADGHEELKQELKIQAKKSIELNLNFQKKAHLENYEKIKNHETTEEKIIKLRQAQGALSSVKIPGGDLVTLQQIEDNLVLEYFS